MMSATLRVADLKQRFINYRTAHPKTRIRDAAGALGVSEAELLATSLGETVTRLAGDWRALIRLLPALGRCMALTRNEYAVSEVRGEYGGIELDGHVGQVLGKAIDLRIFLRAWTHGFTVEEPGAAGGTPRRSLQFFDASGTAVHKIFVEPEGSEDAFAKLRTAFEAPTSMPLVIERGPTPAGERFDAFVDVAALIRRWDAMRDTHEFFHILRDLDLTRQQALRLAGHDRARPVAHGATGELLHVLARTGTKLMIFVGSPGVLQVRSGPVVRVERMGPWLNVLDPDFNLHLREDGIAASWVVRKPTARGVVTSLELFDRNGENILLAFAKRGDHASEQEPGWWRELLAALETSS